MRAVVQILEPDEEVAGQQAQDLLEELRAQDIAHPVQVESAGKGHKDAGAFLVGGQMVLALVASGGVVTTLISAIQTWLSRRHNRSLELTINGHTLKLAGASDAEASRLIAAFIQQVK